MSELALSMRDLGSFKLGECVGGAGVHWGGRTYRFLPWDFEPRSCTLARYGKQQIDPECTSQDWGLTYDELELYYDQFEHIYGVGGKAGNINGEILPGGYPFEGPRSREFPNPLKAPSYGALIFAQAAQSLGYNPFPIPSSTVSQPYANPYELMLGACVNGGYCGHYTCANGAKVKAPTITVVSS
jgi:gluconate 2-dehydrogenase alpha chain